jgi:hypothetical protein
MRFKILLISLFLLFSSISILHAEKTELMYENMVYESSIQTVEIIPSIPSRSRTDVLPISSTNAYSLEFDDLREDADYYFAYLIHCNQDWQPSLFNPIEYLFDYNEFEVRDFEFSIDTRIPYTHYSMRLPRVRLPGNYLIVVYRGNDNEDIILSQRFMVFEERITLGANVGISSVVSERDYNHQIQLKVNYGNIDAMFPAEEIRVVIRQNLRWDNAIIDLKPTFIRADLKEMEYRHFDESSNFKAGNEFRFFDIRTLNFRGESVGEVQIGKDHIDTYLYPDKGRGYRAYSEPLRDDLNGQFYISNVDDSPSETTSEYTTVHFSLKSVKISEDIYIQGAMNNWRKVPANKMRYDPDREVYEGTQFLKQGWYDFQYIVDGPRPNLFEGNYRETRNDYDILIYYGRKGGRGDLLVGYLRITS